MRAFNNSRDNNCDSVEDLKAFFLYPNTALPKISDAGPSPQTGSLRS